jgi:hypothetical protein
MFDIIDLGDDYISGACRNSPDDVVSHLYRCVGDDLLPMCAHGWNRGNGSSFSIARNNWSSKGTCKTCIKNAALGKDPAKRSKHRTRWL